MIASKNQIPYLGHDDDEYERRKRLVVSIIMLFCWMIWLAVRSLTAYYCFLLFAKDGEIEIGQSEYLL